MVGRNRFFFRSGGVRPVSLGGGLEAWKGFYSSVRPAWKQLMVNVNACTTAFYQPRNLAVAMIEFEQSSFGAQAATFVRGVRVKTTHLGYKKTVKKLARTTARLHKFDSGDFGTVTVEQYFKKSTFVPPWTLYRRILTMSSRVQHHPFLPRPPPRGCWER